MVEVVGDAEKSPRLTDWERSFITNMRKGLDEHGRTFELTPRQAVVFEGIERKIYETG